MGINMIISTNAKKAILRSLMPIPDLRKNNVVGIEDILYFVFLNVLFFKDIIHKHSLNF